MFVDIAEDKKEEFNKIVNHPLQSYEWGEFRKATGVEVIRRGYVKNGKVIDGFTLTLHKIPRTKYYIGYLPKGNNPNEATLKELIRIGKENNCIFVQLEPNLKANTGHSLLDTQDLIKPAARPLFTKYTFVLDITKPEDELLKNMHSKTRYNIRLAEKRGVHIKEDNSENAFEKYYKLMEETTQRQKFYAHTPSYHKKLWETFSKNVNTNELSYHLFHAIYNKKIITSWVLFAFHDHLYYPYGASSREHREVMANNLIAWEAIKFGKKMGLKYFDMWGALGPEPDTKDPWYGFHKFKQGYGAEHVEFIGSYDLVIKPTIYEIYKIADKLRWFILKFKK